MLVRRIGRLHTRVDVAIAVRMDTTYSRRKAVRPIHPLCFAFLKGLKQWRCTPQWNVQTVIKESLVLQLNHTELSGLAEPADLMMAS